MTRGVLITKIKTFSGDHITVLGLLNNVTCIMYRAI